MLNSPICFKTVMLTTCVFSQNAPCSLPARSKYSFSAFSMLANLYSTVPVRANLHALLARRLQGVYNTLPLWNSRLAMCIRKCHQSLCRHWGVSSKGVKIPTPDHTTSGFMLLRHITEAFVKSTFSHVGQLLARFYLWSSPAAICSLHLNRLRQIIQSSCKCKCSVANKCSLYVDVKTRLMPPLQHQSYLYTLSTKCEMCHFFFHIHALKLKGGSCFRQNLHVRQLQRMKRLDFPLCFTGVAPFHWVLPNGGGKITTSGLRLFPEKSTK